MATDRFYSEQPGIPAGQPTGRLSIEEVIRANASFSGGGDGVPVDLGFANPGALTPDGIDFNSALWSGYASQLRWKGPR